MTSKPNAAFNPVLSATSIRNSLFSTASRKLSAFLLAGSLLTTSASALAGPSDTQRDRHFQPGRYGQHFDNRPQHRPQYRPQHQRDNHRGRNVAWGVLGTGIALGAIALAIEAPRPPVVMAPIVAPARPPGAMWYFCESAGAYYPYVSYCAEGWRAVPANPY